MKAFEDENAIKKPSDPYSGPRKGFSAALQSIIPLESDKGEVTEPTRQPISWEKILEDRLRRHTKQRIAAGSMHHHDIVSPSDMTIDDVLFAVATFWEPLRSRGRDFAIAGADVIGAAGQLKSSRVVGTGNVFIMPLIFPADPEHVERGRKRTRENNANELNRKGEAKKDKVETEAKDSTSPPGHVLLAIATEDQAPPYNVNIKIYDSRSNTVDSDVIRRKATKVARIWLQRYVQAEISFRRVPQQTGHSNTSGLYVILNAWAAMLNIGPIRDASSRRGGCGPDAEVMEDAKSIGDAQFVEDALQIVNLGLAGSLDSEMFRAFLNYSGYIDGDVAPREGEDDNEDVVIAARMDLERFDRALEQAVNPPSNQASPPTSAHSNDSFEREMEDSNSASSSHSIDASGRRDSLHKLRIKRFLSQASVATLEQAEDYLNATGWDVDEAVYEFGVQQSQISAEIEGVKPLG